MKSLGQGFLGNVEAFLFFFPSQINSKDANEPPKGK